MNPKKAVLGVLPLGLALSLAFCNAVLAQDNPEEELLLDEPVAGETMTQTTETVTTTVPQTTATTQTTVTTETGESVTVPRAVWEQLLRDVEELKQQRATATATTPVAVESNDTSTQESGKRNYLLLPDISVIGTASGLFSNDKRDEDRRRIGFDEFELAIQGDVYPNVRANAFLVAAPGEDEPLGVEEAYLTFLGVRPNLNVWLGRKFVPFGRTGEQHPHSWLYSRQLLPRKNLVAGEGLIGDGVGFRYSLPTGKKLFTNLAVGYWSGTGAGEVRSGSPFGDEIEEGPGAGFDRRFLSARLWTAFAPSQSSELELGASYARGRATFVDEDEAELGRGRNTIRGLDLSYRLFGSNGKRWLFRTEYFDAKPEVGGAANRASGYYGLVNFRFDPRKDIGLLYENSEFPQAPGEREKALSLIYTKQFSERFYARLTGTRGDRPGVGSYNEARIQFTFGLGPHTHELE